MQVGPVYPYRGAMPSGPTVVVVQSSEPPPIICDRYPARISIGLGIALITIGILCVIFNGVLFASVADVTKTFGHGFWSAIMFVISGGMAIVAGKRKTRGSITGFLVMTILSSLSCGPLFIFALIGATYPQSCNYGYPSYHSCTLNTNDIDVAIAFESLLVICAVAAGIVSGLGAVISCKSTCFCCGAAPVSSGVMLPTNYYPDVGQMMYISQTPSTNYFYSLETPPPSFVAPPPHQMTFGQSNWNQPQRMPTNDNEFTSHDEPLPFDPPPSYSYSCSKP